MSQYIGPLTKSEYEDSYRRRDKRSMHELVAEEEKLIDDTDADFEGAEREAIAAAQAAWLPITPQCVDTHFSLWSLARAGVVDVYSGVKLPGEAKTSWRGADDSAIARLRRDFGPDEYEEELEEVGYRAMAEMKEGIGELSPVKYAIHVQVTPTYRENTIISTMAEDYYFLAGYIGWADLADQGFPDRLKSISLDPFLVGLRHDFTDFDADILLDPEVDANFSAIEHRGIPFDLFIGPHQLKHACHLAYRHPKLKLVLNHCGMPMEITSTQPWQSLALNSWRDDLKYLSRYPNVFCKLTATAGVLAKVPEPPSRLKQPASEVQVDATQTKTPVDAEFSTPAHCSSLGVASDGMPVNEEIAFKDGPPTGRAGIVQEWFPLDVLTHAVTCFGPDRCIFGSGWPICRVVSPRQTGWHDAGCGGFLVSSGRAKRLRVGRGLAPDTPQLSVWEACRLVEHAIENAGYGAIEDKRKVFASNSQSIYALNIRPYGSSRLL